MEEARIGLDLVAASDGLEDHPGVAEAKNTVGDDAVLGDATFEGAAREPWGGQRIAFSAYGEIDREQWGINWNHQVLDTGGFVIGKRVRLELEVEAVKTT